MQQEHALNAVSPIFVTGTQRSGTTLIHHILNCSDTVWSKNEMWEIHELVHANHVIDLLEFQRELRRHLVRDFNPTVFENNAKPPLANLVTALGSCAKARGKERWCLKDPRITYFLDDYATHFPDAKFVVLIRDPRAVVHSYLRSGGFRVGRPANAWAGSRRWSDEVQSQLDFASKHPDRCHVLKYETLISNFDSSISQLCEFLDVELTPAMINYHAPNSSVSVHSGNANILRPPDTKIIDKWKGQLTPKQVEITESLCGRLMAPQGYAPHGNPRSIGPLELLAYRLHEILVSEIRWKTYRLKQLVGLTP